MCSFVTDLKVDEGWRLPLLGSASFPLTWGDALTSLCDCKEQNKTRVIPQRRASVQSGACFEWITPTLSPASLFRVLFMISSRRCADQTERSVLLFFSSTVNCLWLSELSTDDIFLSLASPSSSPDAPALLSGSASPSLCADARPPRGLLLQLPPSEIKKIQIWSKFKRFSQ